ncbi:UpxY family transcription antiterminator [Salegentibacter chungangensis]|uniref:UpxY family transcription antiterminator n=1 Tax=Salegentibacter chungangensis TaxID=1335724 RepID=A0ABW3NMN1_9FLAO
MSWYVLYTKPRTEKKTAQALEEMGVEVYCPLIEEVRQWSDRKKKVILPLFKSYVFVNIAEKDRSLVFEVPGVVRYLNWLGKPAVVRDEEIEAIRAWLDDEEISELEMQELSPGDKLIISGGAFKDHKAIIKEVGKKRLRLILPKLGCTVSARIREVV